MIFLNIRNYIFETDFKINMTNDQIDIINYKSIESVSINKITLKYNQGILEINGNNLVIKKLLNDELLIVGDIKLIEFR